MLAFNEFACGTVVLRPAPWGIVPKGEWTDHEERLAAEWLQRQGVLVSVEVAGIRLEPGDPAFALVTLNQLVLEEAVKDLIAEIRAATADFESSAERVQNLAGAAPAREIDQLSSRLKQNVPHDSGMPGWLFAVRWLCTGALLAVVLILVGVAGASQLAQCLSDRLCRVRSFLLDWQILQSFSPGSWEVPGYAFTRSRR